MRKIISLTAMGISWGFTVLVLIMTVSAAVYGGPESSVFIKNVICSALVGIGFTLPSLIYDNENIARGFQTLIHLGIGFVIYIPTAFFAGWIPAEMGIFYIIGSLAISVIFALVVWLCFSLYYKKQAEKINKKIIEKQNNN